MTADHDWLARCDWSRRSSEFGALVAPADRDGPVVMELAVPVPDQVWHLWIGLPRHPNILGALSSKQLRYAALDWPREPVALDGPGMVPWFATCGVVLTRVYEFLVQFVTESHLAWMTNPFVKFDLEGAIRVGFAGIGKRFDRVPPEIFDSFPRCDERGAVFVVGQALRDLAISTKSASAVDEIITRCLERDPQRRYAGLDELRGALRTAGGAPVPSVAYRPPRPIWELLERGLGLLAVDRGTEALALFETAALRDLKDTDARALVAATSNAWRRLPVVIEPIESVIPWFGWADAEVAGLERERARDFEGALAIYMHVVAGDARQPAVHVARGRCQVQLGLFARAVEHAERALALAPDHREAHALCVGALHRSHRYAEALAACDPWLAIAADDGGVHHARGKSLLGLGRLVEAREAFDRACALQPTLVEAMWLRREVDRSLDSIRATVGTPAVMTLDIPSHLAELRDAVIGGRIEDGIAMLRRDEHQRDAVAQLVLGELLTFARRFGEALEVFDRVSLLGPESRHAAWLGTGRTLLALDRVGEALIVFERVAVEQPDSRDAREGRDAALAKLRSSGAT